MLSPTLIMMLIGSTYIIPVAYHMYLLYNLVPYMDMKLIIYLHVQVQYKCSVDSCVHSIYHVPGPILVKLST